MDSICRLIKVTTIANTNKKIITLFCNDIGEEKDFEENSCAKTNEHYRNEVGVCIVCGNMKK